MSDEDIVGENVSRVSRPSLAQVKAVVEYMEKHPDLSHRKMRIGLGQSHAKYQKMWVEMSNIANSLNGAVKTTKGWIKFWADKRRSILIKQKQIQEGKTQSKLSPLEQRIMDICGDKAIKPRKKKAVKQEPCNGEDDSYDENSRNDDYNQLESKPFPSEAEERQLNIMEKLVDVMDQQASAMAHMAQASLGHSKAMEKIAEASNAQALAVDRLAGTFEAISASVLDVRNAILGIDYTMKRCFPITSAQTRQNSNIFS